MMDNMFNGLFGKVGNGMCRLSMNGEIAVKTTNGYKTYNVKTGKLTNCSNFVFNVGEEFFFVIPTNKAAVGDIILVAGKPKCVTKVEKNLITVVNYEDNTVENVIPERHVFMGETYFYGKVVSMFGANPLKGKKGMNKMMTYMMMSEMMRGGTNNGTFNNMLPFMMMGGNMGNMFEGMFDFNEEEVEDEVEESEEE